jgi:hypothetical protein
MLLSVIPSEARNLLFPEGRGKADSAGKNRPRNDTFEDFFSSLLELQRRRILSQEVTAGARRDHPLGKIQNAIRGCTKAQSARVNI